MEFDEEKWGAWMDELSDRDLVVIDDFISQGEFQTIMTFFKEKELANSLKKAGVSTSKQIIETVRGDYTYWLDEARDRELTRVFELIESIRMNLNRFCYLGLTGGEFHLAYYPEGSYYKRHVDQFREKGSRIITLLIYLNENWKKGNGGELRVFDENESATLIQPLARRCVLFKSDKVPHEVLETKVGRYSLTGWFLRESGF